jgi:hypothetical protein
MALNGTISNSAMMLLDEVYDMYAAIHLGTSIACSECSQYNKWKDRVGPCPIFHIGNDYGQKGDKIVFVASQPYGLDGEDGKGGGLSSVIGTKNPDYSDQKLPRQDIIDWMEIGVQNTNYEKRNSIYEPIADICKDKNPDSPDDFFEEIAILNLFPCYNRGTTDYNINAEIRRCCNRPEEKKTGNDLFYRTLKILEPHKIAMIGCQEDEWIVEQVCSRLNTVKFSLFGHVSGLPWRNDKITYPTYLQRILDFIQ